MAEAWMRREAERQRLFHELMQQFYRVEEEFPQEGSNEGWREEFALDLIQVLATYLKQKVCSQVHSSEIDGFNSSSFFRDAILPRIEKFSRAEEESDWMLLELMEGLKRFVNSYFHSKLAKLEMLDPQRIFDASSRMMEVPSGS
jgi:hypothetical protein